jgi:hypothetical protein
MRRRLGKRVLHAVGAAIGVLGMLGLAGSLYFLIRGGHGADAFQNGYGQYETWASYAGAIIGSLLLLLGGFFLGRWQLWRRSRLEGISAKEILKELNRGP